MQNPKAPGSLPPCLMGVGAVGPGPTATLACAGPAAPRPALPSPSPSPFLCHPILLIPSPPLQSPSHPLPSPSCPSCCCPIPVPSPSLLWEPRGPGPVQGALAWLGGAAAWRRPGEPACGKLCMPGRRWGREWGNAGSAAPCRLTSLLRVDPHGALSAASPRPIALLLAQALKLYRSVMVTPVLTTRGSDTSPCTAAMVGRSSAPL